MSEYFVVRRGATALRNETVWDERISFGALGILARALATRPGANLGYRAFTGRGMGEKAVRAALRELEDAGYRHRFTVRAGGGLLRTITVFSDVPISREEALSDIEAEDRARMVGVSTPTRDPEEVERSSNSYPQGFGPGGHRAAASAARLENSRDHGEKSDVTVPRFTVARSTEARSTVPRSTEARSSAALSLRDTNTSSLRSEVLPDQTRADLTNEPETARETSGGRVGFGPVGRGDKLDGQAAAEGAGTSSSDGHARRRAAGRSAPTAREPVSDSAQHLSPDGEGGDAPGRGLGASETAERGLSVPPSGLGTARSSEAISGPGGSSGGGSSVKGRRGPAAPTISEADRLLVVECLPDSMRALDAAGAVRVAALLEERVAAGWKAAEIRRVMDQPLPSSVGRLSSLVASRLERNVVPALAPARQAAESEAARAERRRRRSEALAAPSREESSPEGDPLLERALEQVRSERPDADRTEVARRAAGLVLRWRTDPRPSRC